MDSGNTERRLLRAALYLAALALLLRLGFVVTRDRPLFSDEIDYDRLGWTLATTGSYTEDDRPTAYRPIGYPALVAGIYAIAGRSPVAVHVAQALLGAASVLLIFLIAGGGRTGLWAGGLWAVYPSAILYSDLLMPEAAFTALLLAAALLTARGALERPRLGFLLGMTIGLLALFKPMALLLLGALPVSARLEGIRPSRFAPVLLGALLLFGPWLVRNWIVLGYPTPATSSGANLLIGNHPNATGGYAVDIPSSMRADDSSESGRDAGEFAGALRYIGSDLARFLRNGALKVAHLFGSEGGMLVWTFHPSPGDPSTRLREKYRASPLWLHLAVSGTYALAMLFGILGVFSYPQGPTRAFFLALLATTLATSFVFYGGGRYHFPLMPFLVLFAAGWVGTTRSPQPPRLEGRRAVAVAVIWTGLAGIWIAELATVLRG